MKDSLFWEFASIIPEACLWGFPGRQIVTEICGTVRFAKFPLFPCFNTGFVINSKKISSIYTAGNPNQVTRFNGVFPAGYFGKLNPDDCLIRQPGTMRFCRINPDKQVIFILFKNCAAKKILIRMTVF